MKISPQLLLAAHRFLATGRKRTDASTKHGQPQSLKLKTQMFNIDMHAAAWLYDDIYVAALRPALKPHSCQQEFYLCLPKLRAYFSNTSNMYAGAKCFQLDVMTFYRCKTHWTTSRHLARLSRYALLGAGSHVSSSPEFYSTLLKEWTHGYLTSKSVRKTVKHFSGAAPQPDRQVHLITNQWKDGELQHWPYMPCLSPYIALGFCLLSLCSDSGRGRLYLPAAAQQSKTFFPPSGKDGH